MLNYTFLFFNLIFFFLNINVIQTRKISFYAFTYTNFDSYYSSLINKFNDYSQKNSLGITVELNYLSNTNVTLKPEEVSNNLTNLLDDSINDDTKSIDVVTYDLIYSGKFSEYFIDLNDYFSKERIDSFISSSIESCTTMKKNLISLVCWIY